MIVFLDTGILTLLVTEASASEEARQCQEWFYQLFSKGVYIVSSEICDYEIRRGLLFIDTKKGRTAGPQIQVLERFRELIEFLPVTRSVLLKSAELWAEVQIKGLSSSRTGIDGDILIAAQWTILQEDNPGQYVVIATTNLRHFQHYTEAKIWRDITF